MEKTKEEKYEARLKKLRDPENYKLDWKDGDIVYKSKEKIKTGRASKTKGLQFEARVRADLNSMGWTVDKWMNTIDYNKNELAPAKRKYNPFSKALVIGTGFPDFICFRKKGENYEVVAVEVKSNGTLDKKEKGMCLWLLENKIFPRILIAKKLKIKNRIHIEYEDFDQRYLAKEAKRELKEKRKVKKEK
jgi:hypothetical protein